MIRPPTGATRTYTFFPYTTLFRSYADDLHVRLLVGIVPRRPALARRRAAAAGGAAQRSGFTHRMLPRLACRWRPLARKQTAPLSFRRRGRAPDYRSEEHTSELQSLMRNSYSVFCLKTNKQR